MAIQNPETNIVYEVVLLDKIYFKAEALVDPIAFTAEFSYPDKDTGQPLFLFNFFSTKNLYAVPKGYMARLKPFLKPNFLVVDKQTNTALAKKTAFGAKLRPEQEALLKNWKGGSGMIIARAGFGKTVIGTNLICTYGMKTLILVPTLRILQQWKESVSTFIDRRPGVIASGVFEYDKDIVIASHKSLLKPDKLNLVKKRFGLLLVDECHKAAAPKLMYVINSMYSVNKVGFTATPYRKDLQHFHLDGMFGEQRVEHESAYIKAKVIIKQTDYSFPFGGRNDYNDALAFIAAHDNFNTLVAKTITEEYEKGRNVIVVTPRLEHIYNLMGKLSIPCGHIVSEKNTEDKFENTRLINRVKNLERTVLFGTNGLVGTGFDLAALDTLVLPYSFNNKGELLQIVGRVERKYENKKTPKVIHFFFQNKMITTSQQSNTLGFYEELGHDIYIEHCS